MRQVMLLMVLSGTIGCGTKPTPLKHGPEWEGSATIDPAGDVPKLQGRWWRVPHGEGLARWPEAYLVFDGDIVTFDHAELRARGEKPDIETYQFVLNSSLDPKVIRFIRWLGHDGPLPGRQAPRAMWYKLEGDELTIWDYYASRGESPTYTWRRVTGKD